MVAQDLEKHEKNLNEDPLNGEQGSHAVGVAAGAAAGGVAGGVMGVVGGAVGIVAGTAAGAIAGGLVGKAAGESVNPTVEETYWRANFQTRPYVLQGESYDDYRLAYQFGWERYPQYVGRSFDEVESDLKNDWLTDPARAKLDWAKARPATQDAWNRLIVVA